MPTVYRIQKRKHLSTMLQGLGAQINGGRWNAVGTPLIYASTTPELALLELLVHPVDGTPLRDLPPFVQVTLELPDAPEALEIIAEADLPAGWDHSLDPPVSLRQFLLPKLAPTYPALAFVVRSVVMKTSPSRNILLNPLHPLISEVKVGEVVEHLFDERL